MAFKKVVVVGGGVLGSQMLTRLHTKDLMWRYGFEAKVPLNVQSRNLQDGMRHI